MEQSKKQLLSKEVQHLDLKKFDVVNLVEMMGNTAFQARNLSRAAQIYDMMLKDKECSVILCLAGSLFSAGLKQIVVDMIQNNMIDAIVSTGANIVDQDFFEALGFKHYQGSPTLEDNSLREMAIDRIYDTLIDEDSLRVCDHTIAKIADELPAKPHSSREFIREMGAYLERNGKDKNSVYAAYKKNVPIFVPAFSDCSAGFGLVMHQWNKKDKSVSIDSAKDFLELTKIKLFTKDTGLLMLGGGVPKNFAQDIVVAAELLGQEAPMHKYAVQITVADERDGALSGSTLKEASSWGKVSTTYEQMVFCEATIGFPLLVGYAFGKGNWKNRPSREFAKKLDQ